MQRASMVIAQTALLAAARKADKYFAEQEARLSTPQPSTLSKPKRVKRQAAPWGDEPIREGRTYRAARRNRSRDKQKP